MNAIPPKGQMPRAGNDGVRLTMDFDDEPEDGAVAAEAHPYPEQADADGQDPPAASFAEDPGTDEPAPGHARSAPEQPADQPARRTARPAAAPGPQVPAALAGIEVNLSVEVGNLKLPLKDLLSVEPGRLFALDRMTSEPVTILVNGKPFARGEIVAIGERFGVRLLEIVASGHGEGTH
jgi:flagellar motor switch protein FliN/FliY